MTWTRPKVSGTAPPGRGGHAACALGKKVYVFGGANRSPEAFKDMWALDTGTCCLMPPFAVTHDRNLTPDELRTLPRCLKLVLVFHRTGSDRDFAMFR